MGKDNFLEDYQQFFYNRTQHINELETNRTQNYDRLICEIRYMFDQVSSSVPNHVKEVVRNLDDSLVALEVEVQDTFYRKGFSDGIKFLMNSLVDGGKG